MSIINEVLDKLNVALLTNPDLWGKVIFWGNWDNSLKKDVELPATLVFYDQKDGENYSSKSSTYLFTFTVKLQLWNGQKITTLADYKNNGIYNEAFKDIFKTFLDSLDDLPSNNCSAWLDGVRDSYFESIDERMYINQTFTIKIEEQES